jgi:hypothetical protein
MSIPRSRICFGGLEAGGLVPDYVGLPHFEEHRAVVLTCRHCGVSFMI